MGKELYIDLASIWKVREKLNLATYGDMRTVRRYGL